MKNRCYNLLIIILTLFTKKALTNELFIKQTSNLTKINKSFIVNYDNSKKNINLFSIPKKPHNNEITYGFGYTINTKKHSISIEAEHTRSLNDYTSILIEDIKYINTYNNKQKNEDNQIILKENTMSNMLNIYYNLQTIKTKFKQYKTIVFNPFVMLGFGILNKKSKMTIKTPIYSEENETININLNFLKTKGNFLISKIGTGSLVKLSDNIDIIWLYSIYNKTNHIIKQKNNTIIPITSDKEQQDSNNIYITENYRQYKISIGLKLKV